MPLVLYLAFDPRSCSLSLFTSSQLKRPSLSVTEDSAASEFRKSEREAEEEREKGGGEKFQMTITHSLIKLTRDSIKASLSKQE